LQKGASLLLVSRGVVEAARKKEEFGLDRVKVRFENAPQDNANEIATTIVDAVQQFLGAPPEHNDVTALALVRASHARVAANA
jgi:serine phosphatase RsbU (regulator of sigma subunit)